MSFTLLSYFFCLTLDINCHTLIPKIDPHAEIMHEIQTVEEVKTQDNSMIRRK